MKIVIIIEVIFLVGLICTLLINMYRLNKLFLNATLLSEGELKIINDALVNEIQR